MIMQASHSARSEVTESQWEEAKETYMEGGTIGDVATRQGLSKASVQSRMERYYWAEQREHRRMGLPWNGPLNGNSSVHAPESPQCDELSVAVSLRKKHDREYY